ncbi:uncharacterized protein LOC119556488 isoform X2 [Drosophila subpulchrella]|uniref:uncharacterized protein LOC119556488 isoform X2 n=1 Tax=Drosophila subpulchrella TaxID=1486046 RepID=UPI0018A13A05|nr:uncharacterized protein LOC119556488 isoform X2 [Drosophila subpulchrella]
MRRAAAATWTITAFVAMVRRQGRRRQQREERFRQRHQRPEQEAAEGAYRLHGPPTADAGEVLRAAEVPQRPGAAGAGPQAGPQRLPGENLVPEPQNQMEAADRRGPGTAGGGRQLRGLPAAVRRIALPGRLAVCGRRRSRPRGHAPHEHRHLLPPSGRRSRHAEAAALQPVRRRSVRRRGRGSGRGSGSLLPPIRLQFAVLAEQLLSECGGCGCRESGRTACGAATAAFSGRWGIAAERSGQTASGPLRPRRLRLPTAKAAVDAQSDAQSGQSARAVRRQLFAVGRRGPDSGVSGTEVAVRRSYHRSSLALCCLKNVIFKGIPTTFQSNTYQKLRNQEIILGDFQFGI